MGSESSIFMTRAVIISLLIHAFVLMVMSFFLITQPPVELFSPIKVYFSVSSPEASGAVQQELTFMNTPETESLQNNVEEVVTAQENIDSNYNVIEEPLTDDTLVLKTEDPPAARIVTPAALPAVQNEQTDLSDTTSEALQTIESVKDQSASVTDQHEKILDVPKVDIKEDNLDIPNNPGNRNGESVGNEEEADLQWDEGGAAVLRTVPEPNFRLPYNAILPDTIMISFKVQSDGTVKSVKILPPGSGHVNLDQQIRTYVNSFIFDPFDINEDEKSGLLRLSLRKRGADGT